MRILILTLGSRGDVQPYAALGAALKARGHDVTLATGQGFEDMIEAQGLPAAPLTDDVRQMIQTPEMQKALRTFSGKVQAWRASKGMYRRQLDEMWAVARDIRPDMLVYHHPKGLAAQSIAEALRITAIPTALIPAYIPTAAFPSPGLALPDLGRFGNRMSHRVVVGLMSRLLAGQIGAWRRNSLGLTTRPPRDLFAGHRPENRAVVRLHGFSRHLVPFPEDWGGAEEITGYWFSDSPTDWRPPEDLARFLAAGPPPVYVGFGSMPAENAEHLTRTILEALTMAGRRAVLATGWGGLAAGIAENQIATEVHVLESAPHAWLFPRCAAVVHHGGAGTTHEGLRWGRPSILCPVFGDQPFWGRRVLQAGAGPPPLPQKRLTAAALAGALAATEDPALRARAAALGEALRAEPGAEGAAAAINRLSTGESAAAGRREAGQ
ncbi:glycosyltransferase [Pelagibius sp.]|uniref:glycosyltransferase n=1 Tax=Pelagibius sp. TaxID=1931238 RepID=UPI00261253E7|nr:glycosyltransferase [Pelagibius sp.]